MMKSKDGVPEGSRELYLCKPSLNSWTWAKPDKILDLPAYLLWICGVHWTRYLYFLGLLALGHPLPHQLTACYSSFWSRRQPGNSPVLSWLFQHASVTWQCFRNKSKNLALETYLFWVKMKEMLEQRAHGSFHLLSQFGSTWIPSFLVSCKLDFLSTLLPPQLPNYLF